MIYNIVAVHNGTEFVEAIPKLYDSATWKNAAPYVYVDNAWQPIGASRTLYIPFITSDGYYFYTSDGKMFLVRAHE